MRTNIIRLASMTLVSALMAMGTGGCVSLDMYDEMEREANAARVQAKEARVQYAQERIKVLTLEKRNKELKQQTDKWEANLQTALDRLDGLATDWGAVRDDLLRMNIDRELRSMRSRDGSMRGSFRLEPPKKPAKARKRATRSLGSPEDRDGKKLEEVLQEFRGLLERG